MKNEITKKEKAIQFVMQGSGAMTKLPDNKQWTNRFEIRSESSNNLYIIAQNIKKRFWACSCPGWLYHANRSCKHLKALGLPCGCVPFEPKKIDLRKLQLA